MSAPFYFKIRQPLRGLSAVLITVIIAAIFYYVGTQKFWYEESVRPISWIIFNNYLLLLFSWMFIYAYYFQFWPWSKLSQPAQGLAVTATIIVCAGITFYIMNNMAHWGAHIFPIASCWLFWILFFGGWTDNALATQYYGKQVLGGVSAFFITLGFALLTWYILPSTFLGNVTSSLPFVWFLASTLIGLCLKDYPVQIAHPWRAFGFVGWFAAITFIAIWILKSINLDPLAVTYPVPAGLDELTGSPIFYAAKSSVFQLCVLVSLCGATALFQFWPFHRISPVEKGLLSIVFAAAVGIAVYLAIISVTTDPVVISKVVTWGFCVFVGVFTYYTNFGGAMAPDPGALSAIPSIAATEENVSLAQ